MMFSMLLTGVCKSNIQLCTYIFAPTCYGFLYLGLPHTDLSNPIKAWVQGYFVRPTFTHQDRLQHFDFLSTMHAFECPGIKSCQTSSRYWVLESDTVGTGFERVHKCVRGGAKCLSRDSSLSVYLSAYSSHTYLT